jgi:chemotaxis protein CheC
MQPNQINQFYRDALQELGNIGAGNAATALSQMVGRPITMSVPKVILLPIEKVLDNVEDKEALVAGIYLEVFGDIPSKILLTFPHRNLVHLTDLLLGQAETFSVAVNEIKLSALKELGTILSGAYLNALAKFLDLRLIPSVPALAIDLVGSVLQTIVVELSVANQFALLLQTEIIETETKITGNFYLIPEIGALDKLVDAIKRTTGVSDV